MASSFSLRPHSSCSLRSSQAFFIAPATTPTRFDNGLLTVRYEEALESKPPIAVTVPPPTHPPTDLHPAFRISPIKMGTESFEKYDDDGDNYYNKYGEARLEKCCIERKRDSGMANIISNSSEEGLSTDVTASPSSTLIPEEIQSYIGVRIDFDAISHDKEGDFSEIFLFDQSECDKDRRQKINSASITIGETEDQVLSKSSLAQNSIIPLSWMANNSVDQVSSQCGFDSSKEDQHQSSPSSHFRSTNVSTVEDDSALGDKTERESRNIRLKYELGFTDLDANNDNVDGPSRNETHAAPSQRRGSMGFNTPPKNFPDSTNSEKRLSYYRYQHELAGGMEDWKDIDGCDVDRHGFIKQKRINIRSTSVNNDTPRLAPSNRQLLNDTPRKPRGIKRISTALSSIPPTLNRRVSMKSFRSHISDQTSVIVAPQNHPRVTGTYNIDGRHRKLVEEAGDMLQVSSKAPSVSDYKEENIEEELKQKEWKRVDKWRKMAKVIRPAPGDDGMNYEFDVKSSKLIERTWKGIPDRWRAAAWYSFLRTSARKRGNCPTEIDIVQSFYQLLEQSSADDVQIDIDVPRTINSHIMFRTRYRGGQRLLFRVLHCLSLYFPRTGYVQGMASLAATLLCYYDEEKTFIMLVRLWTLRGMGKLYDPGFRGLLDALEEFQTKWMGNELVAKKLENLNIEPTVYGTRWYLTLFNYSVPFSSQLRVWDIFMLLGDTEMTLSCGEKTVEIGFPILHAISAALIDASRQALLEGDFENVMKTLTSWIPIKDEEILMKVARAEWKLHQKRIIHSI